MGVTTMRNQKQLQEALEKLQQQQDSDPVIGGRIEYLQERINKGTTN